MQDHQLVYADVKLKPLNFSKMRGDDWLLHTEFEIKQINKPPRKTPVRRKRLRRHPRPFRNASPPPVVHPQTFNAFRRRDIFANASEKIRVRLQRLQLASRARAQKKELAKFHAEQEAIRKDRLGHHGS